MSTLVVVAVRDTRIESYMQPNCMRHPGQAVRGFLDEANRPDAQNTLHNHPEDFELWILGTFDEETGEFTNKPERLIRGIDAKRTEA
ncbi:MAG: nonstructural protein [Arizlama microvirus]|nr:MAG: nonstructural protein [Arizlama microvirus]